MIHTIGAFITNHHHLNVHLSVTTIGSSHLKPSTTQIVRSLIQRFGYRGFYLGKWGYVIIIIIIIIFIIIIITINHHDHHDHHHLSYSKLSFIINNQHYHYHHYSFIIMIITIIPVVIIIITIIIITIIIVRLQCSVDERCTILCFLLRMLRDFHAGHEIHE